MSAVYTIGHSNLSVQSFDSLLTGNDIRVLIDVRSKPVSRYRHFNSDRLERRLLASNIEYLHLIELGGHPADQSLYDYKRVMYERIAVKREFKRDIDRVVDLSKHQRIVLMCTEENPLKCHRHPFLARELNERGIDVYHIRRDGSLECANEMKVEPHEQLSLFEETGEDSSWRSPKPIPLQKRPRQ